jgi:hypothetical protein
MPHIHSMAEEAESPRADERPQKIIRRGRGRFADDKRRGPIWGDGDWEIVELSDPEEGPSSPH